MNSPESSTFYFYMIYLEAILAEMEKINAVLNKDKN